MFLERLEPFQVVDIVNKLKPTLSWGHNEIPPTIIKESINYILISFQRIINKSLLTGCVPMEMKIAKVVPIFKVSDLYLLQNYRPVRILPGFSKDIERIMFSKIIPFLNSNNILYVHQYGFHPKHSSIHPLLPIINKWQKQIIFALKK